MKTKCYTFFLSLLTSSCLLSCQQSPAPLPAPELVDYDAPLVGDKALILLPSSQAPSIELVANQLRDPGFLRALERSVDWFVVETDWRKQKYPRAGVTYQQARVSALAFQRILNEASSASEAARRIGREYDVYMAAGCDGAGSLLLTGYHAPIYEASAMRGGAYQFPIYKRPDDLITDAQGAVVGGYPDRLTLNQMQVLVGQELFWFADPLDAQAVEIAGSARLNLTDGRQVDIGYHGTNGHDPVTIGSMLRNEGITIDSFAAIREHFASMSSEQVQAYVMRNPRMIFFCEYDETPWPAGCLGHQVEAERSIATDRHIFPPAAVCWARCFQGGGAPIDQLVMDQDTGGAIRAAGRADLFRGVGGDAEQLAGATMATGHLYYFFLKPQYQAEWAEVFR